MLKEEIERIKKESPDGLEARRGGMQVLWTDRIHRGTAGMGTVILRRTGNRVLRMRRVNGICAEKEAEGAGNQGDRKAVRRRGRGEPCRGMHNRTAGDGSRADRRRQDSTGDHGLRERTEGQVGDNRKGTGEGRADKDGEGRTGGMMKNEESYNKGNR